VSPKSEGASYILAKSICTTAVFSNGLVALQVVEDIDGATRWLNLDPEIQYMILTRHRAFHPGLCCAGQTPIPSG
jgi:hypothetical protein